MNHPFAAAAAGRSHPAAETEPGAAARLDRRCFLRAGVVTILTACDPCLGAAVRGVGPVTRPPREIVNAAPELGDYWGAIHSGAPHSIGGTYYYSCHSQPGASSTATWTAGLDVPAGTPLQVEVFIPGASQPRNRTERARYEIREAGASGNLATVTISQQVATSQWITLGRFPFHRGAFHVRLTDGTGEPHVTRVLVANAMRWVRSA